MERSKPGLFGERDGWDYDRFKPYDFVGRTDEFKRLLDSCSPIFEQKFSGLTHIYGKAGQGKTRLIYELRKNLHNRAKFIIMHCSGIQREAFHPFIQWLKQEFIPDSATTMSERCDYFHSEWKAFVDIYRSRNVSNQPEALLASNIEELIRIESIIGKLIGLEWDDTISNNLDQKNIDTVRIFALKKLIEALCSFMPVVLVVEDIHWIDELSQRTIEAMTRRSETISAKIIVTSRPDRDGNKPNLKLDKDVESKSIDLKQLDIENSNRLIAAVLKHPVDPELGNTLYRYAQGNPFFTQQLSLLLHETDQLELANGLIRMKSKELSIPQKLHATLTERFQLMSKELKETAQAASILGDEFSAQILNDLIALSHYDNIPRFNVQEQLSRGEEELLWGRLNTTAYCFSHSILCEVAYNSQNTDQLQEKHLFAAKLLIYYYPEDKTRYVEIAGHFEKAELWDKAIDYYHLAGDCEREAILYDRSLKSYHTALNLTHQQKRELHLSTAASFNSIGEVYIEKGEWDNALRSFKRAFSIRRALLGDFHEDTAKSLLGVGHSYIEKGDHIKALRTYQEALAICKDKFGVNHQTTAACLTGLGLTYMRKGESCLAYIANVLLAKFEYEKSIEYFEQALEIHKQVLGELHPYTGTTYNNLGQVYWHKGDFEQALHFYNKGLTIRKKVLGEKHPDIAGSLSNIGLVYGSMKEHEKAVSCYKKALSTGLEALGRNHQTNANTYNNLALVYQSTGDLDQALYNYNQSLSIKEEILGDKHPETALTTYNIGILHKTKGEYDNALKCYHKAWFTWTEALGDTHPHTALALNSIGTIYEAKEENEQAVHFYKQSLSALAEGLGEEHAWTKMVAHNLEGVNNKLKES